MAKYRTRQGEVEAFQWNGQPPSEWPAWARDSLKIRNEFTSLQIDGAHGAARANRGDYIIFLNADDIYPCNPVVFAAKYEPVE